MKYAERPALRRFTRHEYARLIGHGFLDEDDPIELLGGLLLVKEPQNSPHRTAVLLVAKAVERAFGEGWFVQPRRSRARGPSRAGEAGSGPAALGLRGDRNARRRRDGHAARCAGRSRPLADLLP
jgi:hypothetical protein